MPDIRTFIPLKKAISAAILDSHEDKGKVESMYWHWGARSITRLNGRILKGGTRGRVILHVNQNTKTATLPCDFKRELFVGIIKNGIKVPLSLSPHLAGDFQEIECVDKCKKCNQDLAICEDLSITEEINLVVINGSTYEQNIIKKLYPNGDYYLETTDPIYNTVTEEVDYVKSKKFIANLDLKDCGCLETTETNLTTLQTCAPEIYGCYYASCSPCCDVDLGSYKIFEDTGLIQLDPRNPNKVLYLEYEGSLPKVNGQLMIPEIAFEAVVEEIKERSIKNRKNEPYWRIRMYMDNAKAARSQLVRELGRVSLSHIIEAAMTLPKFDIKRERWNSCFTSSSTTSVTTTSTTETTDTSSGGTTVVEVTRNGVSYGKRIFTIGESGSPMSAGQSSWVIRTPAGVIESKILNESVNLILDQTPIEEIPYAEAFGEDQLQYKVQYGAGQTTIYLNQAVADGQKIKVSYIKNL